MDSLTCKRLDQALAGWRAWGLDLSGRPEPIAVVPGGLTNLNFRLQTPGLEADLLLRLNHPDPARLGIDRGLEHEIVAATARAGIGRPALHWDPGHRFVVFEHLDARHWTAADFARRDQLARLWPLLEALAEVSIDRPRRCYADYLGHYWRLLEAGGGADAALRERWQAFAPEVEAFDRSGWSAALVHHDLIPANVLDTGKRLVLIDWEYAAPGHLDIDRWSIDPQRAGEPFVAELMAWINDLWARLLGSR